MAHDLKFLSPSSFPPFCIPTYTIVVSRESQITSFSLQFHFSCDSGCRWRNQNTKSPQRGGWHRPLSIERIWRSLKGTMDAPHSCWPQWRSNCWASLVYACLSIFYDHSDILKRSASFWMEIFILFISSFRLLNLLFSLWSLHYQCMSIIMVQLFHARWKRTSWQPVVTMLQYRLYGEKSLLTNLEGFVKAGANIGSVIGQFGFGKHISAWS